LLPRAAFPVAGRINLFLYAAALFSSLAVGLRPDVLIWVPVCFGLALVLSLVARAYLPQAAWLAIGIEGAFLICSLGLSLACLSYVGAAFSLPLQDDAIVALDRMLGFDWAAAARAIDHSPSLLNLLDAAYATFTAQLVLTALALLAAGRVREIERYVVTFVCASLFAEVASMLIPTLGPISTMASDVSFTRLPTIGRTTSDIVLALRDGTMRTIDLRALDGIISFPSLHAAVAVLIPFHLRWSRILFWPAVVLNALMFASAVPSGNHYLSDVLGGIVVAVVGIVAGRALHGSLGRASAARMRSPEGALFVR
jgi:membrane-associated phospholipid phosphatase